MLILCHNYFRVYPNNQNNKDEVQHFNKRRYAFGVFILLLAVVLWVVSSEMTKYLYIEKNLERPFLVTYVRSSLLFIYLIVLCFSPPTRDPCRPADYTQLLEPTAETDDENYFNDAGNTSLGDSTFVPVRAGETTDSDDAAPRAVRFNKVAEVRVMSAAMASEALLARLSWAASVRASEHAQRRAAAAATRRHLRLAVLFSIPVMVHIKLPLPAEFTVHEHQLGDDIHFDHGRVRPVARRGVRASSQRPIHLLQVYCRATNCCWPGSTRCIRRPSKQLDGSFSGARISTVLRHTSVVIPQRAEKGRRHKLSSISRRGGVRVRLRVVGGGRAAGGRGRGARRAAAAAPVAVAAAGRRARPAALRLAVAVGSVADVVAHGDGRAVRGGAAGGGGRTVAWRGRRGRLARRGRAGGGGAGGGGRRGGVPAPARAPGAAGRARRPPARRRRLLSSKKHSGLRRAVRSTDVVRRAHVA